MEINKMTQNLKTGFINVDITEKRKRMTAIDVEIMKLSLKQQKLEILIKKKELTLSGDETDKTKP